MSLFSNYQAGIEQLPTQPHQARPLPAFIPAHVCSREAYIQLLHLVSLANAEKQQQRKALKCIFKLNTWAWPASF